MERLNAAKIFNTRLGKLGKFLPEDYDPNNPLNPLARIRFNTTFGGAVGYWTEDQPVDPDNPINPYANVMNLMQMDLIRASDFNRKTALDPRIVLERLGKSKIMLSDLTLGQHVAISSVLERTIGPLSGNPNPTPN